MRIANAIYNNAELLAVRDDGESAHPHHRRGQPGDAQPAPCVRIWTRSWRSRWRCRRAPASHQQAADRSRSAAERSNSSVSASPGATSETPDLRAEGSRPLVSGVEHGRLHASRRHQPRRAMSADRFGRRVPLVAFSTSQQHTPAARAKTVAIEFRRHITAERDHTADGPRERARRAKRHRHALREAGEHQRTCRRPARFETHRPPRPTHRQCCRRSRARDPAASSSWHDMLRSRPGRNDAAPEPKGAVQRSAPGMAADVPSASRRSPCTHETRREAASVPSGPPHERDSVRVRRLE